jgi:ribosomal protein S18 acetylase RimI-like enzyme
MIAEITEESVCVLPEYGSIPIAFQVKSRYSIEPIQNGLGGFHFVEEQIEPYIKDYDAIKGERPSDWLHRWDTSNWCVLSAFVEKQRIGGAVVAWKTEGLNMLADREDLSVLWDLRIHPNFRRSGIGRRLFDQAVEWSRNRHCSQMVVETQNINVPACQFYVRKGCQLGAINRYAYKDLDEVQFFWYKAI